MPLEDSPTAKLIEDDLRGKWPYILFALFNAVWLTAEIFNFVLIQNTKFNAAYLIYLTAVALLMGIAWIIFLVYALVASVVQILAQKRRSKVEAGVRETGRMV